MLNSNSILFYDDDFSFVLQFAKTKFPNTMLHHTAQSTAHRMIIFYFDSRLSNQLFSFILLSFQVYIHIHLAFTWNHILKLITLALSHRIVAKDNDSELISKKKRMIWLTDEWKELTGKKKRHFSLICYRKIDFSLITLWYVFLANFKEKNGHWKIMSEC